MILNFFQQCDSPDEGVGEEEESDDDNAIACNKPTAESNENYWKTE